MNSFNKILYLSIILLLLSSCATTAGMTFISHPYGAMISYQDGSGQLGVAPVRVEYQWDERYVQNGCLRTKGVKATWLSGATSDSSGEVLICGGPNEYSFALSRPEKAKGLKKDMDYAIEVERTRILQQQARQQAEQQATLQTLQMIQMYNAMNPPDTTVNISNPPANTSNPQQTNTRSTVNCSTRAFGSTLSTTCR